MNYADLFRATLPETALEIAALLVLVVDLGFLRKAALKIARRRCGAAWRRRLRRGALGRLRQPDGAASATATLRCCWPRAAPQPSRKSAILVLTALTLLLLIDSDSRATRASMLPWC